MHICFVGSQYPPELQYDGGSTLRYISARLLARRGHKVSVVTCTRQKPESQKMEEGVCVWRLYEPQHRTLLREDFRHFWKVRQAVEEIKPDIVQVHEAGAEGFLLSQFRRRSYKLVTRMASYTTLTKAGFNYDISFRNRILSYLARQQSKHSHALYAPTIDLARQVEKDIKLKPGSIRHIVNGIMLDEMQQYRETSPELDIKGPYLVYYGRVEEPKGAAYLAQALPLVWEKFPWLKVVLIGLHSIYTLNGEPARQYLEKLAGKYAGNLVFTGHLPREKALPIVAHAKLAVLPTLWEAFSYACLEAIALGVPVITTGDSGGPAEIIAGTGDEVVEPDSVPAGWLVPRRNSKALAAAILEALSDDEIFTCIKANTLKRARRYDAERMVDQMEALYNELLR